MYVYTIMAAVVFVTFIKDNNVQKQPTMNISSLVLLYQYQKQGVNIKTTYKYFYILLSATNCCMQNIETTSFI